MAAPPSLLAQEAAKAQTAPATAPAQTPAAAAPTVQSPQSAPAAASTGLSRQAMVQAYNELAWPLFEIFRSKIPGMLVQNYVQEQLAFSQFHACDPGPYGSADLKKLSLAEVDTLLSQLQGKVSAYLESHQATIGKFQTSIEESGEFDSTGFKPQAIVVNNRPCVPQKTFSPMPAPEGEAWTMKRHLKRQQRQLNPGQAQTPFPVFVGLALRKDSAPVTNNEVRTWIGLVSWLRDFRQSLALYEAYRAGKKELSAPPSFELSAALGKKVERILKNDAKDDVGTFLRTTEDNKVLARLTPAQLTADKIYNGQIQHDGAAQFPPCAGKPTHHCFTDGRKSAKEALDEKITLVLQNPDLTPGEHIDVMIMLAKELSVLSSATLHRSLPKSLWNLKLPDACRIKGQEVSFLGDGVNEYEEILNSLSNIDQRAWWVGQVTKGVQELVFKYQTRELKLSVPPEDASKVYQAGDALIREWVRTLFNDKDVQASVAPGQVGRWQEIGQALEQYLANTTATYSNFLRLQQGQQTWDDFSSIVGEKLLVAFGAIQSDLAEALAGPFWNSKRAIVVELVRKAVVDALVETLGDHAISSFDPRLFIVTKLDNGEKLDKPIAIMNQPIERALKYWQQNFEGRWETLLNTEGFNDTQKIAESIVTSLYNDTSASDVIKEVKKFDSDALAREDVHAQVNDIQKQIEEAARAQETVEYMRSVGNWQNGPTNLVAKYVPSGVRPWVGLRTYDDAVNGLPGTVSACFYAKDDNGHGKGISTFGDLDPNKPTDYEFLKKALSNIVNRAHSGVAKRMGAKYPDSVLQSVLKVANKDLAASIELEKIEEVLRAEDVRDRGRVSAIRTGEFSGFDKWLDNWRTSEKWFTDKMETLSKNIFEAEIEPVLALRPKQGDQSAWEAYLQSRLTQLFRTRFPLSTPPTAKQFLALYEEKGVGSTLDVKQDIDAIQKLLGEIASANVFIAPGKPGGGLPDAWAALCKTNPQQCLNWVTNAEAIVGSDRLRLVRDAVAARDATAYLFLNPRFKAKKPLNNVDRITAVVNGWYAKSLAQEQWIANDPTVQDKTIPVAQDLRKAASSNPQLNGLVADVDSLVALRKQHIDQVFAKFDAFLKSLDANPDRSRESVQKQLHALFTADATLFTMWKEQALNSLSLTKKLIQSGDPAALKFAYQLVNATVRGDIRVLSEKDPMSLLKAQQAAPFHMEIAKNFLPSFFDFRNESKKLLKIVQAPQVEAKADLLELEKLKERGEDAKALLKERGKEKSAEGKEQAELIARLAKLRAEALERYTALERFSTMLEAIGDLDVAAKALASLKKLEAKDSLFQTLYKDDRKTNRASGASVEKTLADINKAAALANGTQTVKAETARHFLEDLGAYCRVGRTSASRKAFETAFESTLRADIAVMAYNDAASKRVSAIARIGSSTAKTVWQQVTGQSQAIRESLAGWDWSTTQALLDSAKASGKQVAGLHPTVLIRNSLPTVDEVCASIETRAATLQAEIKDAAPEAMTSAEFRAKYWELVEFGSGIFLHRSSYFAPLVNREGAGAKTTWFRNAPADVAYAQQDELTKVAAIATDALTDFLLKSPPDEVLSDAWDKKTLEKLLIAPLTQESRKDLIGWLSATTLGQRLQLFLQLRNWIAASFISTSPGTRAFLAQWAAPADWNTGDEKVLEKTLVDFADLWLSIQNEFQMTPPDASGYWKPFARNFIALLAQSTLYRISGDQLEKVASDDSGDKLAALGKALFVDKMSDTTLMRLANAASAAVKAAKMRASETGEAFSLPWLKNKQASANRLAGNGYFLFSINYILRMPETLPTQILTWQSQVLEAEKTGKNLYAAQPMAFNDAWAPIGKEGEQFKDFDAFMTLAAASGLEQGWKDLRKSDKDAARLWNKYDSLEKLKNSAEYQELTAFFKKWDRNAKAKDEQQTYPYFLALLNWNIHHYGSGLQIHENAERQQLREVFIAKRLDTVVDEIGLDRFDFDGWKKLLVEKDEPIDWQQMAEQKRTALVDIAHRRFFSTWIDAPKVDDAYWAATSYNVRAVPIVDPKERTQLASDLSFGEWFARTQDPARVALYRVMEGNGKQIPLYQQMVADGLQMQGQTTVSGDIALKNQRNYFKQGRANWAKYFSDAAKASDPALTQELVALLHKENKNIPTTQLTQVVTETLKARELLVALRAASDELVIRYRHDKDDTAENFRLFDSMQADLNAMLAAYAENFSWKGNIPEIKTTSRWVADRHREGAGKAVFLASNLAFANIFMGQSPEAQKMREKILTHADTHFRKLAHSNSYVRGLLAVADNIQDNLTKFCQARADIVGIKTPEEFKAKKDKIWELRIPLMDNLFRVIEEMSPPGASDVPRRLLQRMIIEDEIDKAKQEKWEQIFSVASTGLFVGVLLLQRTPSVSRAIATAWWGKYALQPAMALVNMGIGAYWGKRTGDEIYEDFVTAPRELKTMTRIRDGQAPGVEPMMTNESAAVRVELAEQLEQKQMSTAVWLGRLWSALITLETAVIPAFKMGFNSAKYLARNSRWLLGGTRARFLNAVTPKWRLWWMGSSLDEVAAVEAAVAENTLGGTRLSEFKKALRGWEKDGLIVPSKDMAHVLLTDVRAQIKSTAATAELDPISLQSIAKSTNSKLAEMQASSRLRLQYLHALERKLVSSTPHVTVDDVIVLLAQQGTVQSRHRPIYLSFMGLPNMDPAVIRLGMLRMSAEAGVGAQQGMFFYYASGWVQKNREKIEKAAEALGVSEEQFVQSVLDATLFNPGRAYAHSKAVADALKPLESEVAELRAIFRFGRRGAEDAALIKALIEDDFIALEKIALKTPWPIPISPEAESRLTPKKEDAALVVGESPVEVPAGTAPTLAPVADVKAPRTTSELRAQLLQNLDNGPVQPISNFDENEAFLKDLIVSKIDAAGIDRTEILRLIKGYSSERLSYEAGQALRLGQSTVFEGTAAELRIAAACRETLEFNLRTAPRGTATAGTPYSMIFRLGQDRTQILARELTITEAKGVLGMSANEKWSGQQIRNFRQYMRDAQTPTVKKALDVLERFSPETRQLSLHEYFDVLEMPTHRFSDELLIDLERNLGGRLEGEEARQLTGLLRSSKGISVAPARATLRMPPPPEGQSPEQTASEIRARAKALTESLQKLGLEATDPAFIQATKNIERAESYLLGHYLK